MTSELKSDTKNEPQNLAAHEMRKNTLSKGVVR